MAAEIRIYGSLDFTKGGSFAELVSGLMTVDMSGAEKYEGIQVVGTSEEALLIPTDLSTPCWFIGINRDASNYISLRRATGEGNLIKIPAGKFAGPFLIEASAPYVIANIGSCRLEYLLVEA